MMYLIVLVVVQPLRHVRLFATPWIAAHQVSLFFTICRSSNKLMSVELILPSNHLILCRPLLLLPSIFPSISVFSNESTRLTETEYIKKRWQEYTGKLYQRNKNRSNLMTYQYYHVQKAWISAFANFVLIMLMSPTESGNATFCY